jgi:hypothetical protein
VPDGLIIVQTPNAVSLGKRIKMALGRNPFEQIRADDANPGHYREYTLAEVSALLEDAQFSVKKTFRKYYFDARFARHSVGNEQPTQIRGSIKNVLYRFLPPGMREGITIVAGRT